MAADKKNFTNPMSDEDFSVLTMMGVAPEKIAAEKEPEKPQREAGESKGKASVEKAKSAGEEQTEKAKRVIDWEVGRKKLPDDVKKRNRVVCVMDDILYNKLKEAAQKRHVSISSFMNEAAAKEVGE